MKLLLEERLAYQEGPSYVSSSCRNPTMNIQVLLNLNEMMPDVLIIYMTNPIECLFSKFLINSTSLQGLHITWS